MEGASEEGKGRSGGDRKERTSVSTVFLGGIPPGLRVSQLKSSLREKEATPLRLSWQGAQHRAFLDYSTPQAAERALHALQGLCLDGHSLRAELAKSQRGGKRAGPRPPQAPQSEAPPPGGGAGNAQL